MHGKRGRKSNWSRSRSVDLSYEVRPSRSKAQFDLLKLQTICREAPSYKQRIAGKSLPTEKFVIKKTARFFAQGDRLRLAALELLYVWNILKIVGKEWALIQACYRLIERTIKDLKGSKQGKRSVL